MPTQAERVMVLAAAKMGAAIMRPSMKAAERPF
jgi:hypothetical protein